MLRSVLKRASPAVMLGIMAGRAYAATNSSSTELQQLMSIAGKIIAFCLVVGAVFSILALVKAGYAIAVEDNPQQAKDRLRRALAGVILMAIAVPFVAFIWFNFMEPYGYELPNFNP